MIRSRGESGGVPAGVIPRPQKRATLWLPARQHPPLQSFGPHGALRPEDRMAPRESAPSPKAVPTAEVCLAEMADDQLLARPLAQQEDDQ